MSRSPLPARILIPVANPLTAEELIKLGSAILDKKNGELTALGIVEVPEGMPLSEGATRARHARRLLQRVLDFAPEGTTIPADRAHRPAGGRGHHRGIRRAGVGPRDLRLGRQGAERPQRPRPGGVLAHDRRGRARLAVRHRGRQAARRHIDPADPRAGPRRAARRARDPLRRRDRTDARGHGRSPPPRPARDHGDRPRPGRARAGRIHEAAPERGWRGAPARGAEPPGGDPARGREGRPRGDGRLGQPFGADGEPYLFGALPESIAARAKPTVIVVKTREQIASATFDQLASRAETLAAADRAAEEVRAVPAASIAGSASRTSTIPSSATWAG